MSDLRGRKENSIGEAAFDIAMAELFWIQLRGIGREELNMNFRVLSQIVLYGPAQMGSRVIPNQNKGSTEMTLKMFQSFDDFL